MRRLGIGFYLLLCPFALWLLLLIILPHLNMLEVSLNLRSYTTPKSYTFQNYLNFFEQPLYWNTFVRTAWMSILATLLTLLIAFPMAYYIAKLAKGRSKTLLLMACILPFWLSELVRTYGWMIILRESGLLSGLLRYFGIIENNIEFLYNDASIMLGLVYTAMLFMIVPLVSALESLDDSHIEAGYDLGGSHWNVLREIVIPHAMPGIVSGCIIVFMLSLGNYLTPNLIGGKDSLWFTEQIFTQFITRFNWEQGSAFGILLLLLSSLIVYLGLLLSGQTLSKTMGK
ncbi:ABC transporter permease [Alginatibacterium sediminis]|uniref:ABC transporter permease n=1 Tax=Alginatibacterium sediminis TaxID=2164068 RepID=A0A420E8C3_9ALTE|nr:ABC transporter permease [Alginatibacterium sediminis]RKF15607.1 ABC transporter permease [Alginatibacterium sediminis]